MLPHGQRNIDWLAFSLYLALSLIGIMMIYTVGYKQGYPDELGAFLTTTPVGKQIVWLGISLTAFFLVLLIDWKFWSTFAYPIYAFGLLLLVAVLIFGTKIKGATSWFAFGGFTFQPSEIAKLGTCLAVAAYLSSYDTNLKDWRHQLTAAGLVAAPMLLILLQPDAGSALTFLSFGFVLYRKGWPAPFFVFVLSMAALFILGLATEPLPVIALLMALGALALVWRFRKKRLALALYAAMV
ncbi:MAG: rod shape-determining protein RodA, partial [Bacteroidetes bacterium]